MRAFLAAIAILGCAHHRPRFIDRTSESNLACTEDPSRSGAPELPDHGHCDPQPSRIGTNATRVDELTYTRCNPAESMLTHDGPRSLTREEQMQFLARHRAEMLSVAGVVGWDLGSCCKNSGPKADCLRMEIHECASDLELARTFAGWMKKDGLSDARLSLLLNVSALRDLRCDGRKGPCGPIQNRGPTLASTGYRCDKPRKPLDTKSEPATGRCAHDGECNVLCAGGIAECRAWTEVPAEEICKAVAIIRYDTAFCGCVAGSCTWFTQ